MMLVSISIANAQKTYVGTKNAAAAHNKYKDSLDTIITQRKLHVNQQGIQMWRSHTTNITFKPATTVLVFIDVWCWHPFPSVRLAVEQLVPRINKLVEWADSIGMRVLWAPYDSGLHINGTSYIDPKFVSTNNPVFDTEFRIVGTNLNSDVSNNTGSKKMACKKTPGLRGLHPDLKVKPNHLTIESIGTKELRDMGIRTAFLGGMSLSECLIHRSVGAKSLIKSGIKAIAIRDYAYAGGDPTSSRFTFADDSEMTELYLRVFEKWFDGSVSMIFRNPHTQYT